MIVYRGKDNIDNTALNKRAELLTEIEAMGNYQLKDLGAKTCLDLKRPTQRILWFWEVISRAALRQFLDIIQQSQSLDNSEILGLGLLTRLRRCPS